MLSLPCTITNAFSANPPLEPHEYHNINSMNSELQLYIRTCITHARKCNAEEHANDTRRLRQTYAFIHYRKTHRSCSQADPESARVQMINAGRYRTNIVCVRSHIIIRIYNMHIYYILRVKGRCWISNINPFNAL